MEARQTKSNEDAGYNRLIHQLASFATADPAKGIGYAGAVSAQASQELEDKQNALRDKQETAQIEFAKGIEKEEDARKRKDSDGIKAALDQQQKAKFDYAKAEHDRGVLAAHIYQTDEYSKARKQAASEAAANKPDPDDVLFTRIMDKAQKNPTIKALAKKLEEEEIGTDRYNQIQAEMQRMLTPYFAQRPDLMPPKLDPAVISEPAKKPGFWESVFGSSKPANKTVSFDKLPQ